MPVASRFSSNQKESRCEKLCLDTLISLETPSRRRRIRYDAPTQCWRCRTKPSCSCTKRTRKLQWEQASTTRCAYPRTTEQRRLRLCVLTSLLYAQSWISREKCGKCPAGCFVRHG